MQSLVLFQIFMFDGQIKMAENGYQCDQQCNPFSAGIVFRRQNLTPGTERIKIFIMAIDP